MWYLAKLSKFVQISMLTSTEPFLQRHSLKIKKGLELVPVHIFKRLFDKKFHFVILHKLSKFHYQTVFTSQVIQYVFHVS